MLLARALRLEQRILIGRWLFFIVGVLASVIVLCDARNFVPSETDINVGAFNIKQFGTKKCQNEQVMQEIARIVSRFDIIAIQEIRDDKGKTVPECLLNYTRHSELQLTARWHYKYVMSDPLGRKGYKERYALFYRMDIVRVNEIKQSKVRGFLRQPFAVHVEITNSVHLPEFLFIVAHTKPRNAKKEINLLSKVYHDLQKTTGLSNAIIGGDLNADCSYWNDSDNIELTEKKGFCWLIDSNTRTNVRGKGCAYDRFIVVGDELRKYVGYGTDGTYMFAKENTVSDHYPIGMHLLRTNQQHRSLVCNNPLKSPPKKVCRRKTAHGRRNLHKPLHYARKH